jgi:hypothetical protein
MQPIKRLERLVLRPLWIVVFVAAIWSTINARWWLLAASIGGFLYLGAIGAKVHAVQSASDLAAGPTTSPAAHRESEALTGQMQRAIISPACTHVGILCGIAAAIVASAVLGYPWWVAAIALFLIAAIAGGILKFAFALV